MNAKSTIVTGAANGIGLAVARACHDAGYRVGLLDIDTEALQRVASTLAGSVVLIADVTDEQAVAGAFDAFGTPTLVVNNAGVVRFETLTGQSVEAFRETVNINLVGNYIVAREAANRMAKTGGGQIVNITSINSITPGPGIGAYPATKAGVKQMTRQLAIELGHLGIRVNAIAPGFIDAGMGAPLYTDSKIRELRSRSVPAGRLGTAEDIAGAVLFLDSDAGAYVNGHELVVDGGVVYSLLAQLPRE